MQTKEIKFLKQFLGEYIALPRGEELSGNICLRYFGRCRKEKQFLNRFLEKYIAHSDLADVVSTEVERQARLVTRRMKPFMKELLKTLPGSGRRAHYPPAYGSRLATYFPAWCRRSEGEPAPAPSYRPSRRPCFNSHRLSRARSSHWKGSPHG
jgi:hypothetical protein